MSSRRGKKVVSHNMGLMPTLKRKVGSSPRPAAPIKTFVQNLILSLSSVRSYIALTKQIIIMEGSLIYQALDNLKGYP